MAMSFRHLCVVVLATHEFLASDAARKTHRRKISAVGSLADGSETKLIAGVTVHNYHLAYGGKSTLLQMQGELSTSVADWTLMFKRGVTDARIGTLCKLAGDRKCLMVGHPDRGGVPFLELRGTETDLEDLLLSAAGEVEFLEPDLQVQLSPEEELGVQTNYPQWNLDRVGAYQRPSSEGQGSHVYVLDTGVRTTHQDFGGRAIPTLDMTRDAPHECNGDATCADDNHAHGTHCAGIVGGATYGVAPKATLHAMKVLGDPGGGAWSATMAALDWIATTGQRPAVVSWSFGGLGVSAVIEASVDAVVVAGVTVVVAAGNDETDACAYTPPFIPSTITVGSTDNSNAKSSFSNVGTCIDIWAPGTGITSANHYSNDGERYLSGTSMACPHVAGAAALLLGESPSMSPQQVRDSILGTADAGAIGGLSATDNNKLLWVGASEKTTTTTTPYDCPSFCSSGMCWYANCQPCLVCQ